MKSSRAVWLLFGALAAFVASGTAGAAPNLPPQASDHASVVAYWTPGRVNGAIPRDLRVRNIPQQPQGKPSGGGGGGGTVGGATWTGGDPVRAREGKILFTLDGLNYVCSGTVLSETRSDASIVLTAGHCVFDDVTDHFATNLMFIPDYQAGGSFSSCGTTRFGCWAADVLVTTNGWKNSNFESDYAFAVMSSNSDGGQKTNVSDQLDVAVGGGYALGTGSPATASAFGYPAAGKYNGRTLTYCQGTVINDPYGADTNGMACDMTGGSSGGAWFSPFGNNGSTDTIVSLNSYKYVGGVYKNYMFGPRFDQHTLDTFGVALAAGFGDNDSTN